jgi:hypothetical protein
VLVVPVNGLRTRSHDLMLVHSIIPHARSAARDVDPDQRVAAAMDAGRSGPTLVSVGSAGQALNIAMSGLLGAAAIAGVLTDGHGVTGHVQLFRHQAWPDVPVDPPR